MPDGAVALRTSTVLDDYVFLFGGCSEISGGVVNRDSAFRYDPARGEWRELRPLPVPVRGLTAARLGTSRILLAGGYTAPMEKAASSGLEDGFTNEVWIYDTGRDRYERATPLPFAVSGIDVIVHDGLILALGGEDRMRSRSRRFIQGKVE
jgi:N-acetylneuraminic acid mutarotase